MKEAFFHKKTDVLFLTCNMAVVKNLHYGFVYKLNGILLVSASSYTRGVH